MLNSLRNRINCNTFASCKVISLKIAMVKELIVWAKGVVMSVADLLFPRYCFICGNRLTASEEGLCNICMMSRPFAPLYSDNKENELARLFMGIFHIEKAQAMMRYSSQSGLAQVIYEMKYYNKPELGVTLGRLCAKILKPSGFFDDIDLIVPVPLAKSRKRQRGYNQSEMIAEGISRATGIEVACDNVVRLHFKQSQTHLNERERRENVEGNFKIVDTSLFEGKHVLLVDDVVTTGATLKSCGGELAANVANLRVSVFTIGRTAG